MGREGSSLARQLAGIDGVAPLDCFRVFGVLDKKAVESHDKVNRLRYVHAPDLRHFELDYLGQAHCEVIPGEIGGMHTCGEPTNVAHAP